MLALLCLAAALAIGVAAAMGQSNPLNDLFALGQGTGDTPSQAPVQQPPEPSSAATPLVPCGAGSHPEPGVDGRVPAGSAANGLNCNMQLIAHQGTEGGFKVLRYIDAQGHDCAFYDTTLLLPLNALNPGGGSAGVAVLDMSDPAHPVQTATLTTPPMLSPHESLNLNPQRGLLAAVNGNPATEPGLVAVYDVRGDCLHPVLDSLAPVARLGHESGFSTDGRTFYATSTAYNSITAVDLTNPKAPSSVWEGNIFAHGMTLSDDGNRAYIADPRNRGLLVLDTSQIQGRVSNPKTREVSRLTWSEVSIPQNAIPFTENGHPYLLEIDEYNQSTLNPSGDPNVVGAARIIDIADETHPSLVSNLRLQIDQPADHAAAAGDPGAANNPAQGYAAHYCNFESEINPKVVACSFIASGLRVFNISNILHPKEIAYYVAPPQPRSENGFQASDFGMSKPVIVPERREIWWTDGTTGFYVLRVAGSVWPSNASLAGNSAGAPCQVRRRLLVGVHVPRGAHLSRARATLAGQGLRLVRSHHRLFAVVDLRHVRRGTLRFVVSLRLANGRLVRTTRAYRVCSTQLAHRSRADFTG